MQRPLICLAFFLIGLNTVHALPEQELVARKEADQWLKLVDRGWYAESWEETVTLFREAISQEDWVKAMDQVRKPLGKAEKRTLKALIYTQSLPQAPPGTYVVVQYETKFANRDAAALETIVPMYDEETQSWRISGYYIK
ncbi:MAG: DUF4019 domain-containing protein [Verrucomicrobiota bacterium]